MTPAGDVLVQLRRRLAAASASASLDAELLLAHVLGCGRTALAARPERVLTDPETLALEMLAVRRLAGVPIAYLIGRREFWSLDLEVTPDVLVPRPETELLVEIALTYLADIRSPEILDLGTGSGALALALAKERPDAAVTAVDQSEAALTVAKRNARRHGIDNVRFLRGCWYAPVAQRRFHAIVSNPPYIADGDSRLAALAYEPQTALAAGPQGLDALAAVCAGAASQLYEGGLLVVEHGPDQGFAARSFFTGCGLAAVATRRDLAGLERATSGMLG